MITGEAVVAAARTWVDTPYRFQARGPKGEGGGCDCVGLLAGVGKELGLMPEDYDPTGYSWLTDGTQLRLELAQWAYQTVVLDDTSFGADYWQTQVAEGDILLFKVAGWPTHTGWASFIDYGSCKRLGVIHALHPARRVVEHVLDDRWARRIVEVWRLC